METQICSRPLRLSPLKNSFSELNTLWDRDDEITFEDVLGGDCCSPRITCRLDFESRLPLGLYYSLVLFVLSHTPVNSNGFVVRRISILLLMQQYIHYNKKAIGRPEIFGCFCKSW